MNAVYVRRHKQITQRMKKQDIIASLWLFKLHKWKRSLFQTWPWPQLITGIKYPDDFLNSNSIQQRTETEAEITVLYAALHEGKFLSVIFFYLSQIPFKLLSSLCLQSPQAPGRRRQTSDRCNAERFPGQRHRWETTSTIIMGQHLTHPPPISTRLPLICTLSKMYIHHFLLRRTNSVRFSEKKEKFILLSGVKSRCFAGFRTQNQNNMLCFDCFGISLSHPFHF